MSDQIEINPFFQQNVQQQIDRIGKYLIFLTNYSALKKRPMCKALGSQTIGTTEIVIAHGLNRTPNIVITQMTTTGNIWQSTAADATNIYLKADSAGRICNVEVIYIPDNLR